MLYEYCPRALDVIHTLYTFLQQVLVTPLMYSFNKTEAAIFPMQAMLPFLRLFYQWDTVASVFFCKVFSFIYLCWYAQGSSFFLTLDTFILLILVIYLLHAVASVSFLQC